MKRKKNHMIIVLFLIVCLFLPIEVLASEYHSFCNDPGLAVTLTIIQDFIAILQIAVPIILILMAAIEFSKLMINPDEKKGKKGIFVKCAAAVIFFFLPFVVDLGMDLTEPNFNLSGCWRLARTRGREIRNNDSEWQIIEDPNTQRRNSSEYGGRGGTF